MAFARWVDEYRKQDRVGLVQHHVSFNGCMACVLCCLDWRRNMFTLNVFDHLAIADRLRSHLRQEQGRRK